MNATFNELNWNIALLGLGLDVGIMERRRTTRRMHFLEIYAFRTENVTLYYQQKYKIMTIHGTQV